jgi:hypothetical protein
VGPKNERVEIGVENGSGSIQVMVGGKDGWLVKTSESKWVPVGEL